MKSTSSLSLLVFIRMVSASPIPIILPDCKTSACTAFVSNPNTPPTKLTEPHFPLHHISSSPTNSEAFDNTPITPSSKIPAHKALAAAFPLSSAFLKSLANPASKAAQQGPVLEQDATTADLPAKPTSALPELRREDARLYWASRGGVSSEDGAVEVDGPRQTTHICGYTKYLQVHRTKTSKNYGDFMVVGIVLLFLAVVIALEAIEKVNGLRNLFISNGSSRRGAIYLEDDETALIIKKSSSLHQAPPQYSKITITEATAAGNIHYDFETYDEKA